MKNTIPKNKFLLFLLLSGVYLYLIFKLALVEKTIVHSDNFTFTNCYDFGIFYLLQNFFNIENFKFVIVDLTLFQTNQENIINFDQLFCIGRTLELTSQNNMSIYIGFDSYMNSSTYIIAKTLLFFLYIKTKKPFLVWISIVFDILLIILFPLNIGYDIQFLYFVIFYSYILINYSTPIYKIEHLKFQKYLSLYFILFNLIFIFQKIVSIDYMIGYWLANYKYGFIKRGMTGNILINISDLFGFIDLISLINLFLIIVYLLIFYLVFKIFNSKKQPLISYFIFLSPAFISFFNIDDTAIGRPEILGVLTLLYFYNNRNNLNIINFSLTVIFYTISIFSHSINVFIAPFLILLIARNKNLNYVVLLQIFSFVLVTLIFIFMFINNTDTLFIEKQLCIDAQNLEIRENICEGAIGWLGFSVDGNLQMIHFWQHVNQRFYLWYFLLFSISIYPIVNSGWVNKNKSLFILPLLSLLPLLYLAYDWGRYIWVYCFIISVFTLDSDLKSKIKIRNKNFYFVTLYSSLWYLPVARGLRLDNIFQNMTFRLSIALFLISYLYLFKIDKNEEIK